MKKKARIWASAGVLGCAALSCDGPRPPSSESVLAGAGGAANDGGAGGTPAGAGAPIETPRGAGGSAPRVGNSGASGTDGSGGGSGGAAGSSSGGSGNGVGGRDSDAFSRDQRRYAGLAGEPPSNGLP